MNSPHHYHQHDRKQAWGFTLVEVLLALSLLTVVSLGVIQMVTRSQQIAQRAEQRFVAVNIAREGLELVRALRDTSWFSGEDRSTWIDDELCQTFTYDIAGLRNGNQPGPADDSVLYIQGNGEWGHGTGDETLYHRTMEVDCSEKDANPPRVMVTSRVFWEDRGQSQEVILKERLYNWLP